MNDITDDWFWEGNVQKNIARFMETDQGYEIRKLANTKAKQRGPDIEAVKSGIEIVGEVKGYPSIYYSGDYPGGKKGDLKPTRPIVQAKIWVSHAIFKIIQIKSNQVKLNASSIEIALGFPDFAIYRELMENISWFRGIIKLGCYFVNKTEVLYYDANQPIELPGRNL